MAQTKKSRWLSNRCIPAHFALYRAMSEIETLGTDPQLIEAVEKLHESSALLYKYANTK